MVQQSPGPAGPPERSASDWEARYENGPLPWDSGVADHNLLEILVMLKLPMGPALEIGCGTGTNSVALAQYGFSPVVATDIAPRAIAAARANCRKASLDISFHIHDILTDAIIPGAPLDGFHFIFDRGVLHSMMEEELVIFARRVESLLRRDGWWLSLCGNADDQTPGGPPRLSATQIASVVEPFFEIHTITREQFRGVIGEHADTYLNWRVLLRKR